MWDMKRIDQITEDIIGCAIHIHRRFGPVLYERVYETLLYHMLVKMGYTVEQQKTIDIEFDGIVLQKACRLDLLVENCIIVEIKAVDFLIKTHENQLLAYLRVSGYPTGLLINFHAETIKKDLIRRDRTKKNGRTPKRTGNEISEESSVQEPCKESDEGL
jgi:iron complex transport system substrate-binding protein